MRAAIPQESVGPGDVLMVDAETSGMATGVFEYTLGATEDGPIRVGGQLAVSIITPQRPTSPRPDMGAGTYSVILAQLQIVGLAGQNVPEQPRIAFVDVFGKMLPTVL